MTTMIERARGAARRAFIPSLLYIHCYSMLQMLGKRGPGVWSGASLLMGCMYVCKYYGVGESFSFIILLFLGGGGWVRMGWEGRGGKGSTNNKWGSGLEVSSKG